MLGVTDLKKDTLLQIDGTPYKVIEYNQKQMGRGGSIVNVKIKNLLDGSVIPKTFKGNEKLEEADVTFRKVQYLYSEGETLHFMDSKNYEQFELETSVIGDAYVLLTEGLIVTAQLFNGNVINVDLPVKIELGVSEAPDVTKGDTQSTVQKNVTLETGAEIQAPIFIKQGDRIVVDSRDLKYVERAK